MKKVIIVGNAGSGKSTLARQLGAILDLDVIHLDALYWQNRSTRMPEAQWQALVEDLVACDTWIMEGNCNHTIDLRFAAADTLIVLDLPRLVCYSRVIKRQLQFWRGHKPQVDDGSIKKLSWYFLKWIWKYPIRYGAPAQEGIIKYSSGRRVITLRGPQQTTRLLTEIKRNRVEITGE